MKTRTYWWIEKVSTGRMVVFGRTKVADAVHESGCPNLQDLRKDAQELCREGERPIRVKIIK